MPRRGSNGGSQQAWPLPLDLVAIARPQNLVSPELSPLLAISLLWGEDREEFGPILLGRLIDANRDEQSNLLPVANTARVLHTTTTKPTERTKP